MVAGSLTVWWKMGQTARNEKMRIRSNVNLGALLEAQGGYHAAFDAAFSVRAPTHSLLFLAGSISATSCAQPRSSVCLQVHTTQSQSARACIQSCMHTHAHYTTLSHVLHCTCQLP